MARRKLTSKEVEEMFLDLWYNMAPEVYDSIYDAYYKEGIAPNEGLISDCARFYPSLYKKIMNLIDDKAIEEGFSY